MTPPFGDGDDRRSPPLGGSVPTGAARLAEVIELSHEGLALIDADGRFEFATPRAAATLEQRLDDIVGAELATVLPELAGGDLATIAESTARREPMMIICTHRSRNGRIRALRLTFVPRRNGRGAGRLMMLTHDITPLRVVQDQRRRAQHRLTAVEDEEQRQIHQELHDGPTQILAALALRVGMSAELGIDDRDRRDVERAVDDASRELREILAEPTDSRADTAGGRLRDWASPLLAGTGLRLTVTDDLTIQPNRATAEALFTVVHRAIRRAHPASDGATIAAELTIDAGQFRLRLTVPRSSAAGGTTDDHVVETVDDGDRLAMERYAALLGGTYREATSARSITMVATLPPLDEEGWSTTTPRWTGGVEAAASDLSLPEAAAPAELSVEDYEALARASFQGLVELDADLRVVATNEAYARATKRPAEQIVGRRFADLFDPADYRRLLPLVRRVRAGEPVRFEWRRRDADGDLRWIQVAGSARLNDSGRFVGALLTTLDTTDLHLAEDLRDRVLVDLDRARRDIRRRTATRLSSGPIRTLDRIRGRLAVRVANGGGGDAVRVVHDELDRCIAALESSVGQIADPDLSEASWSDVLRASVRVLIEQRSVDLVIEDRSELRPHGPRGEALVKIARDAVTNSIRQGLAQAVRVRLDDVDEGYRLQIFDDGVGIQPGSARPSPEHLGTRTLVERAREQGGRLVFEGRDGGGTVITATIPHADEPIAPT